MKNIVVLLLLLPMGAYAQNSKVDWWAFDMGFANSTGETAVLKSAVGVGCVGTARGGNVLFTGGFLADTLLRGIVLAAGEDGRLPSSFSLSQNFPNPFNPRTVIAYAVPGSGVQASGFSEIRLAVYDILGREVAVLVEEKKTPGRYEVEFDGSRLASGVYFYRLRAGQYIETKKMMLMK